VNYKTDIKLGERYRDDQTGTEGTATAITFYQHGCERASIEVVAREEIKEYGFDAPRLTHVSSGVRATTARTGGPARGVSDQRPGPVDR
jgi:hypothetical protein